MDIKYTICTEDSNWQSTCLPEEVKTVNHKHNGEGYLVIPVQSTPSTISRQTFKVLSVIEKDHAGQVIAQAKFESAGFCTDSTQYMDAVYSFAISLEDHAELPIITCRIDGTSSSKRN